MVLGAMLIGSINYNNNLGFLLTFLLGSLGLTAMMHTYSMLYGLRLVSATSVPAFAGKPIDVEITVAGIDRQRTGIRWHFNTGDHVKGDLLPGRPAQVVVSVSASHRGLFDPGWLRISSEYPLGLFQAWARINTGLQCLVYPRPVSAPAPEAAAASTHGDGHLSTAAGVDDFQGLSAYQPGDPPRRIHWQAYSRGRGLHVKTFAGRTGTDLVLDMARIEGEDIERKLSILCFHVLRAHHQRRGVALTLAGRTIPAGSGRLHRDRCLRVLALYGEC